MGVKPLGESRKPLHRNGLDAIGMPEWGSGGRKFKSSHPDVKEKPRSVDAAGFFFVLRRDFFVFDPFSYPNRDLTRFFDRDMME